LINTSLYATGSFSGENRVSWSKPVGKRFLGILALKVRDDSLFLEIK
jgi:hypothetical protein